MLEADFSICDGHFEYTDVQVQCTDLAQTAGQIVTSNQFTLEYRDYCDRIDKIMTLSSPPNRVFQFGDTDGTKDNTAISDSIQLNNLFDTGNCGGLDFTSGHSCTVNFVSNTGLATCITTGVIASSGSVVRQRMDWVNCNAGYYAPEDVTVTCSDSTGSYSKTSETF